MPIKTAHDAHPAEAGPGHDRPCAGCGHPAAWVTGDKVNGADPGLRADLERRQAGYVLAVAATHRVTTGPAGTCQARQIADRLPRRAWQRYSAGEGAKGHRYDWAWVAIDPGRPGHRWLRIRRTVGHQMTRSPSPATKSPRCSAP